VTVSPSRRTAGLLFAAALSWAGGAAADCAATDGDIKAALAAGESARYDALFRSMLAEDCDAAYREQIGRAMARSALTTVSSDAEPPAIEAVTRFGRPWQVLVALGDSYFDRKDWTNAVRIYEEALDDMRDTVANPKAPPEDVERRVYKRAVEARALAPSFVATRQFRGVKSGLASPAFRNFTIEAVPVPVRFEYDSDQLTADGVAAVTDIYAFLSQSAPDRVVIIGHTDPRGAETYNNDLSLRRADTVGSTLAELGYAGTIEIYGRGESEPFAPDDPAKYGEDELYAFDRRVEYRLPQ
jgi:outer membrane protein OmpA-like peptidoglycan-associated protein